MSNEAVSSRRSLLSASIPAAVSLAAVPTLFGQMTVTEEQGHGHAAAGHGAAPAGPLADYLKSAMDAATGAYALPKLPYAYEALEPHIDAQTMTLHHSKHHQAYVDNANKALKAMRELKGADVEPRTVEALQRDLSFNVGGHVMHTLFWAIMGPNAGGEPTGAAAAAISKSFGDYANFKAYFTKVAMSVKGAGWAVLAQCPMTGSLMTSAMGDQDTRLSPGVMPVLAIDVWEHAYYLKYQNKRADYVAAWFNTINWTNVNAILGMHAKA